MQEPSRKEIWKMFDQISPTYDKANRAMTLWLDLYWRRQVCRHFPKKDSLALLDLATGTGDQIAAARKYVQNIALAIGIDLAEEMLALARKKIPEGAEWINAGALAIPYPAATFDCATMSFGIRNVTDIDLCLKEMARVLKPKGRGLILEGSMPPNPLVKGIHLFYLRHILPRIGGTISKNKEAYLYLNKTIETFPSGANFCKKMNDAGFAKAKAIPLTCGVVTLYVGEMA